MQTKISDVLDKAENYEDSVKKTEIRNTLRILFRQVGLLSGKDLDIMRNFLDKLVNYS